MDSWRELAACRDSPTPDVWFPVRGETTLPAKQVCAECPVSVECLEYALAAHITWGVWGGYSDRERRRMRKVRRAA